jgi:hypothetical protein
MRSPWPLTESVRPSPARSQPGATARSSFLPSSGSSNLLQFQSRGQRARFLLAPPSKSKCLLGRQAGWRAGGRAGWRASPAAPGSLRRFRPSLSPLIRRSIERETGVSYSAGSVGRSVGRSSLLLLSLSVSDVTVKNAQGENNNLLANMERSARRVGRSVAARRPDPMLGEKRGTGKANHPNFGWEIKKTSPP